MTDYDIDLMRENLKTAANLPAAKRDLIENEFLARRGIPERDRITTTDIANALGRDDAEREALAEAFRVVDRDEDVWLQCANIWLALIGAIDDE